MTPDEPGKVSFRRYLENGGKQRRILVRGRRRDWRDGYHAVLEMPWWLFGLAWVGVYGSLNALFGFLFWLDPGGLNGARPGSYADAFNFSVETLGTIGYGVISPHDGYTNALVTVEAFLSLAFTALATGMTFARVSRPTARIRFTSRALITTFDGRRTFMFRVANQRGNQVLEADVSVALARSFVTAEGEPFRKLEEVRMQRSRSPLFALTWTVMHTIDETSPLHGATGESLHAERAEFIAVVSGLDETYAQRVHARHSYAAAEIVFDHLYGDVLRYDQALDRMVLDYTDFDALRPNPPRPTS